MALRIAGRYWPWFALALSVVPSVWYVLDFESDIDPEFPRVARPTFSTYPPPAYRFAEAGDTIDHIAVYVASAAIVLSAWGLFRTRGGRLWLAALAVSVAGYWHAATPGPLLDGWHGLGWRVLMLPTASIGLRLGLAVLGGVLLGTLLLSLRGQSFRRLWALAREHHVVGLLLVSAALVVLRQAAWVDREPLGFWPRWLYVWGLLAWALALLRLGPPAPAGRRRAAVICTMLVLWFGLDVAGRGLFWCQRPVRRLREIVPGKIYLSGMPTYRGLALAHDRHHFKTIINLFPEYTDEGSPLLSEELAFVRDHGLTYIGNENTEDPTGEAFIARTMEVAQDPDAWPILVHCHASMDRSPAWVGMYRFAVQGWPLADAIREIERHRGLRPKASVTLLFNRVIPLLARDRAAHDPTLPLLRECARGTKDPALSMMSRGDRIVVPREAMAEETPLTERR